MDEKTDQKSYRLPAEWEPHETTWISWPTNRDDWPGKFGTIPWVYVDFVRLLSPHEPVSILVPDREIKRSAADKLDRGGINLDRVRFVRARTDRSWTRDFVPSFVLDKSGQTHLIDWKFNGWAKYDNHQHDDRIPRRLARHLELKRILPRAAGADGKPRRIVLEGGAIDSNGLGSLLTTEECLLSDVQARNPHLDKQGIEQVLDRYLGIKKVIWLGRGIAGDDTHGHVDDITRFVGPRTVVTVVEPDPADPNHEPLQDNLERLHKACDQEGRPLEIVPLPMPGPVHFEGQRLPASYANFYIANGVVLVPVFNDPADTKALDILARLFPDRKVVGVYSRDLVWGLGTLHCMTHEQPAASPPTTALKHESPS